MAGRPTTYRPEYSDKIIEFFSPPFYTIKDICITKADGSTIEKTEMEALPPVYLSDFARSIGVARGYSQIFKQWGEKFPEFNDALKEAKILEVERIRSNALMGLYNSTFSIFTMKNIGGWRDEQHLKGTGFETKQLVQVYLPQTKSTTRELESLNAT